MVPLGFGFGMKGEIKLTLYYRIDIFARGVIPAADAEHFQILGQSCRGLRRGPREVLIYQMGPGIPGRKEHLPFLLLIVLLS